MSDVAPSGPAGRRDPDARRSAVLDAARSLFTERGVAATSIDDVARRAGVAKGTVYLYFRSKDDLARALEQQFTAGILERTRGILERTRAAAQHVDGALPHGLGDALERWCCALAEAYLDDLAVHDALFYGWAPASREGAADNPLIDDLAVVLTDHGVSDPDLRAAFVVGGVTTLVDRALLGEGFDRAEVLRAVSALAALFAGSPSPSSSALQKA